MTDDERSQDRAPGAASEDEEDGTSPFDHPAFLPVLLWALAIWFGYDGWLNSDPDMAEHITFNRVGFGVLVLAGTYYTVQALRGK
jgi:hypothetical protein